MNARFEHPSARGTATATEAIRGAASFAPGSGGPPGRACCCAAIAAVMVTISPGPSRPHTTDLFLCAHHYRASCRALASVGAHARALPGTPFDVVSWSGVRPDAH
jgi:hypothetical protein